MGTSSFGDDRERMMHLGLIHEIARMCGRPETEVEKVYESELSKLKKAARVTEYLPVLARRVALDHLRHTPPAGDGI